MGNRYRAMRNILTHARNDPEKPWAFDRFDVEDLMTASGLDDARRAIIEAVRAHYGGGVAGDAAASRAARDMGVAPGTARAKQDAEPLVREVRTLFSGHVPSSNLTARATQAAPATQTPLSVPGTAGFTGVTQPATLAGDVPQAPPAQPQAPEPVKRTRLTPMSDARIGQYSADLRALARQAGWAEMGGRGVPAGDRVTDENVRTPWVAYAQWWRELPERLSTTGSAEIAAVEKAIAGQPMTAKEKRFVLAVIEQHEWEMADEKEKADAKAARELLGEVLQPWEWEILWDAERADVEWMINQGWEPDFSDVLARMREREEAHAAYWRNQAEVEGTVQGADPGRASQTDQAGGNPGTEFTLQGETPQQVKARELAENQAAKDQKATEAKRAADAQLGDFVLTGSDRAVDQAEARGQSSLRLSVGRKRGLQSNDGLPENTPRNRTLDGAELAALRRAAAGIESPVRGITLQVTPDGRAVVTGPARLPIPARFKRFAEQNGLVYEARRGPVAGTRATAEMPEDYREAGALYAQEMGPRGADRTDRTRFSLARYASDDAGVQPSKTRRTTPNTRSIPASLYDTTSIGAAIDLAGSQIWPTGRTFKIEMDRRALAAFRAARRDPAAMDDFARDYMSGAILREARAALLSNPNAVGWYDENVSEALFVLAHIHPELATDPYARFAFTWALAVTSNGQKVDKNFELAEEAYVRYRDSGTDWTNRTMPSDIGIGTTKRQINKGLATFNRLVKERGIDRAIDFATTKTTVRQVKAGGYSVTGEGVDTVVYGSAIIGPKIGNGFFSNLYGSFDALTMDRWLMRTWGRLTGTLVHQDRAAIEAKSGQLRALFEMLTPQERRALEQASGVKLRVGDIRATAAALAKATAKEEVRDRMNAVAPRDPDAFMDLLGKAKKNQTRESVGSEIRKMANGLTRAVDGQKEDPDGARERDFIRSVFSAVLADLQKEHPKLTMADLQALLWYPEKRLYDSAKMEETEEGYDDDEAPNYANAARGLARSRGISAPAWDGKLVSSDRRAAGLGRGERERGAGLRASPDTGEETGQIAQASSGDKGPQASRARFFSPLARAVEAARQDAQPAQQWKLWLASNTFKQPGFTIPDAMRAKVEGEGVPLFSKRRLPDTITVDGVDRPTTNSNGQPIHPTEEGIRNFWKWFAGSKVVDAEGRPLVMYHGTAAEFDTTTTRLCCGRRQTLSPTSTARRGWRRSRKTRTSRTTRA